MQLAARGERRWDEGCLARESCAQRFFVEVLMRALKSGGIEGQSRYLTSLRSDVVHSW